MTKLHHLRARLHDMLRRRRAARWLLAYSALVVSVIGLLAALFAVDYVAQPTRPQRIVALVIAVVAFGWLARRFVLPWLGWRETELDMALLVQREQQIDSDLVAALQFESSAASTWGSPQLETAVVDYVAEYGQAWDNVQAVDRPRVRRRIALLVTTVVLAIVASALFPRHVSTFFHRLALGNQRYPSATNIDSIEINGQRIEPSADTVQKVRLPFGRPVQFSVFASGEPADSGVIHVSSDASAARQQLALTRVVDSAAEEANYGASLAKLVEGLTCEITLGDAYSDPIRIEAMPLPIVEVQLTPTPPTYANLADSDSAKTVTLRQLSVLEGSRVDLAVVSANKPLTKAAVVVNEVRHDLVPQDSSDTRWSFTSLPPALTSVAEPVSFSVEITDADGLQPDEPLQGQIRIRADRKPSIVARCETLFVLPTAKPRIHFSAEDDFGLSTIQLQLEIVRGNSSNDEKPQSEPNAMQTIYRLDTPAEKSSAQAVQTSLQGSHPLDLSGYKLAPEDQVRVRVLAIDYRGAAAGQSATTEPITLNVTDLSGIYAAMYELEKRAYDTTGGLIDRQTETGASP